jgi:uracil-DNA glycosylase family 4
VRQRQLTGGWDSLEGALKRCRECPRLVEHRERIARVRRRAYADEEYWGRPVPSFGDRRAGLVVVGLAPAAHGANRTGRMFTGDRSGDWLFRALHRAGFASQARSTKRSDGLVLSDCLVTAAVRCAPPGNRPLTTERDSCRRWLEAELDLLAAHGLPRVLVALGQFAYDQTLRTMRGRGFSVPRPKPRFAHGVEVALDGRPAGAAPIVAIGSYHPSQQNTFTGRLTEEMLDAVFERARTLLRATGSGEVADGA